MEIKHIIAYGLIATMLMSAVFIWHFDRRKRAEHRRIMQGRRRYPTKGKR